MKIAALADIHGNLPALEAVLSDVEREEVDQVVICGDVASGPMPMETLAALRDLAVPTRYVRGNADRELVSAFDSGASRWPSVTWTASRIDREARDFVAAFEPTVSMGGAETTRVLFCHGSPRDDNEIITAVTPPDRLEPMLAAVAEELVVCGHSHHQFELHCAGKRVINTGAVGEPYEWHTAAYWLLIDGTECRHRRSDYDVEAAIGRFRLLGYPDVEAVYKESLLQPRGPDSTASYFEEIAREAAGRS